MRRDSEVPYILLQKIKTCFQSKYLERKRMEILNCQCTISRTSEDGNQ